MPKALSGSPTASLGKNISTGILKRNQVIFVGTNAFYTLKVIGGLSSMQKTEIGKVARYPNYVD